MGNSPPTRRKPLKILHVTGVDGGGVVDALRTYIRLQNEAVHFVAATNEIVRNDFAASGADTLDMSGSPLRARRVLRRYVRERAIDVVHAHSSWGGFQARASALGAPIIYQPHSFYFDNPNLSRLQVLLYQSAERLLSRRTDAFAVLTAHEERLAAGLEPGVPLYRLHNVSKFSARHRIESRVPTSAPIVIMSGRIAPQKDPRLLRDIARETASAGYTFVWVGDGDPTYRQELERAGVVVTGWLADHELHKVLAEASVYLHTAAYEGFPLAILDAAQFGLPILVRDANYAADTALLTFQTVEQAVAQLGRLTTDRSWLEQALAISAALSCQHSDEALTRDLDRLYSSVAGVG